MLPGLASIAPHVRSEHRLHPATQVSIAVWPQNQVKMIRKQTPGEQPNRQPLARLHHQIEERDVVFFLVKHLRPAIAPIEQMVANSTHRRPCCS